jgi:general secretion pathway protein J
MTKGLKRDTGFTLLELMISLTIVSLIVLIIFGCFRVGIRAWVKGEEDVDVRQRLRIVMELMKHQLASASLYAATKSNGKEKERDRFRGFRGSDKSLEFVSRISLIPGNELGPSYVKYVVEPEPAKERECLKLYEKKVVFIKPGEDFKEPLENDFFTILSGAREIKIEYLKGVTDVAFEWQSVWDPDIDKGLPLAVRITVDIEDGEESAPVSVLARILNED